MNSRYQRTNEKAPVRLGDALETYWRSLKGHREFPTEAEIDPSEIKNFWDNCFLINVTEGDHDSGYKYAYLGQGLIDAYGDDFTKEEVNVLVEPNRQRIIEKVEETVETRAPVYDEGEFTNAAGVNVRYRKVFLPLGDRELVEYVLGGIRWKGY